MLLLRAMALSPDSFPLVAISPYEFESAQKLHSKLKQFAASGFLPVRLPFNGQVHPTLQLRYRAELCL